MAVNSFSEGAATPLFLFVIYHKINAAAVCSVTYNADARLLQTLSLLRLASICAALIRMGFIYPGSTYSLPDSGTHSDEKEN